MTRLILFFYVYSNSYKMCTVVNNPVQKTKCKGNKGKSIKRNKHAQLQNNSKPSVTRPGCVSRLARCRPSKNEHPIFPCCPCPPSNPEERRALHYAGAERVRRQGARGPRTRARTREVSLRAAAGPAAGKYEWRGFIPDHPYEERRY